MTSQCRGVLIRNLPHSEFELLDSVTRELIVKRATLADVLAVAAAHGVTVWQQNVDERGRALGDPVELPPSVRLTGGLT